LFIVVAADLDQPHLSQAWQALSSGDGPLNEIGLETYIYDEVTDSKAFKWDYGKKCIKILLQTPGMVKGAETYYLGCDAVDCCKGKMGGSGRIWDIGAYGGRVQFDGYLDTTELNDVPITGAESWSEEISYHGSSVIYFYKIHREDSYAVDKAVRTHRIDYGKTGTVTILYGNFTQLKDIEAAKAIFKLPAICLQDDTLYCDDNHASQYFKHATFLKQLKERATIV